MSLRGIILHCCKHIFVYVLAVICVSMFSISGYAQDAVADVPQANEADSVSSISIEAQEKMERAMLSIKQKADSMQNLALIDSTIVVADTLQLPQKNESSFNPDGMRAVWLSALFPGLGQIYNRRYWKLPIVVGGFMGLIYATSWNGRMYADYQQAYLDVMDSDPNTNSYMDFFPSYYKEENIDKGWLQNILKTRKDTYRHYRDYCVVGMVALYLVCILDAYVDAELYHFDMSPDLAVVVKPALIPVTSSVQNTALGLQCAITF